LINSKTKMAAMHTKNNTKIPDSKPNIISIFCKGIFERKIAD
jgi:hypothetical protein